MSEDLWKQIAGSPILAGAAGGLVRWLTLRSKPLDGAISILVGGISAAYLGPLASPTVDVLLGGVILDPAQRGTLTGFIIGLGGISIVGFVMDLWRAKRDKENGNNG